MWLVLLTLVVVLILMWLSQYLPGRWEAPAQVAVLVIAVYYLLYMFGALDLGLLALP